MQASEHRQNLEMPCILNVTSLTRSALLQVVLIHDHAIIHRPMQRTLTHLQRSTCCRCKQIGRSHWPADTCSATPPLVNGGELRVASAENCLLEWLWIESHEDAGDIAQAKGALSAAQGSGPLPPFERWSMAGHRYVQFLTDLRHVHSALEAAIAAVPFAAAQKQIGAPAGLASPTLLAPEDRCQGVKLAVRPSEVIYC